MERILQNLVSIDPEIKTPSNVQESNENEIGASNNLPSLPIASTNSRMETLPENKEVAPTDEEEMDDVMNVLKDLNDVASGTFATNTSNGVTKTSPDSSVLTHNVVESLTSVQDVAKVVDFSKNSINDNSSNPHISASQAAEEMCARLNARQTELEKRFESINNRVNQIRCRQFGSHVVDELTNLRSVYEGVTQPLIQSTQSINNYNTSALDTPRIISAQVPRSQSVQSNTTLSGSSGIQLPIITNNSRIGGRVLPPGGISLPNTPVQITSASAPSQTVPSGITLPSMGQISAPSLPTTPLAPSDIDTSTNPFTPRSTVKSTTIGINLTSPLTSENSSLSNRPQAVTAKKVKVEKTKKTKIGKEKRIENASIPEPELKPTIKHELPTEEENENIKDGLNHLESNLRHLIHSYDSEATESSSGGESCDEFDGYLDTSYQQNQRVRESKLYQRLKSQQSSHSALQTQIKSKTSNSPTLFPPPIKQRAKWAWLSNR